MKYAKEEIAALLPVVHKVETFLSAWEYEGAGSNEKAPKYYEVEIAEWGGIPAEQVREALDFMVFEGSVFVSQGLDGLLYSLQPIMGEKGFVWDNRLYRAPYCSDTEKRLDSYYGISERLIEECLSAKDLVTPASGADIEAEVNQVLESFARKGFIMHIKDGKYSNRITFREAAKIGRNRYGKLLDNTIAKRREAYEKV